MSISGTWYNELGSVVALAVNGASITGTYQTAVGDANGVYSLVGSIDVDGDAVASGQAVAWVVVWNNQANGSSHSITAWSGLYQMIDGEEAIEALWLLTSEEPSSSDWASTVVNKDVFTRNAPNAEMLSKSKKKVAAFPARLV
jgi:hypothetical protein